VSDQHGQRQLRNLTEAELSGPPPGPKADASSDKSDTEAEVADAMAKPGKHRTAGERG
jgi:hypothetical protein